MAETIETLIDASLRRVRDTGAAAHSRASVLTVLSNAQKVVNVGTFAQVRSSTMTTNAEQLVYQVSSTLSRIGRILGIQHEGRELDFIEWRMLKNIDPGWWRRTGPQFKVWSAIGRDLLIIYPALTAVDHVGISYVDLPATVNDESEGSYLPDDENVLMVDIAEVILRIRTRQLSGLDQMIKKIESDFQTRRADIAIRYPLGR